MAGRDGGQSEEPVGGPRAGELTSLIFYSVSRRQQVAHYVALRLLSGLWVSFKGFMVQYLCVKRDSLPITGRSEQMFHCGPTTLSTLTGLTNQQRLKIRYSNKYKRIFFSVNGSNTSTVLFSVIVLIE